MTQVGERPSASTSLGNSDLPLAEVTLDTLDEFVQGERLGEVASCSNATGNGTGVPGCRHKRDGAVWPEGAPIGFSELPPIHARHVLAQQDEIRLGFLKQVDGFKSVPRGEDFVVLLVKG